jgi:hypothetical protein
MNAPVPVRTQIALKDCSPARSVDELVVLLESIPMPVQVIVSRTELQPISEQNSRRCHKGRMIIVRESCGKQQCCCQLLRVFLGKLASLLKNQSPQTCLPVARGDAGTDPFQGVIRRHERQTLQIVNHLKRPESKNIFRTRYHLESIDQQSGGTTAIDGPISQFEETLCFLNREADR